MKIALLTFILAYSSSILADGGLLSCDTGTGNPLDHIYTAKCYEEVEQLDKKTKYEQDRPYCDCLEKSAVDNVLVKSVIDDEKGKLPQKKLEAKRKYQDRFYSVFKQMTIGAAAQSKILEMDDTTADGEKLVGCTAGDISKLVSVKSDRVRSKQTSLLVELRQKKIEQKEECRRKDTGCIERLDAVIKDIDGNLAALGPKDACLSTLEMMRDTDSRDKLADIIAALKNKSDNKKLQRFKFYQFLLNSPSEETIKLLKATNLMTTSLELNDVGTNCAAIYNEINSAFSEVDSSGDMETGIRKDQCPDGDSLCAEFDRRNNALAKEVAEKFKENPDNCVSRAEYETFKGLPSPALLKALIESSSPGNLLTAKDTFVNGKKFPPSEDTIRFLRANPAIAKLSSEGNARNRNILGEKLKSMALAIQGKDDGVKLKAYLDFMKGDVKPLLKSRRYFTTQMYVCNALANNFTAIRFANDLPDPEKKANEDNSVAALFKGIATCQGDKINQASMSNLGTTLATSPIFTLGQTPEEDKDDEGSYNDFKDKICQKYPAFVAKECAGKKDTACREHYLAGTSFAAPKAEMKDEIKSALSLKDVADIRKETDETKQDHKFKEWWQKNVGSKLNQDALASRGEEDDFIERSIKDENFASSVKIPSEFDPPVSPSSRAPANIEAPEQAVRQPQELPSYAQAAPSFDAGRLAQAKKPQDMIPNFDQLSAPEQKQSLDDVKKFVSSKPNAPFSVEDVAQEIKKIDESIGRKITDKKAVQPQVGSSPSVAAAKLVPSPTVSQSLFAPASSFSSGFGQGSVKGRGNEISKAQKKDGRNEALLKLREEGALGVDRGPASIERGAEIHFQSGLVDPGSLEKKLLVSEEVLVPATHEEYVKIKGSVEELKKFLASNVGLTHDQEAKVYKIKDPTVTPESYILFHVSRGSAGAVNVKTIDRKSTLTHLGRILSK